MMVGCAAGRRGHRERGFRAWSRRVLPCLVLALLAASLTASAASAGTDTAYSHDASTGATNTDWMTPLDGTRPLSSLSIPGTHDSGAYNFGALVLDDVVLTQSMDLSAQLAAGIRAFDIRLGEDSICNGMLFVFHGSICQLTGFTGSVLAPVTTFLAAHPGEAVVMRIAQQGSTSYLSEADFVTELNSELGSYSSYLYKGGSANPALVSIRGKIFVLQNFTGSIAGVTTSIGWSTLNLQDNFSLGDNWDLADKWNDIRNQLNASDSASSSQSTIYGNFLTASGGGFPYFFASGKSSPGTGDPPLLTGWTRGIIDTCQYSSQCIPEYDSVNCFLGTCSVAFRGANLMARDYISDPAKVKRRTGIVFADFPGSSLISAVIGVNSRPSPKVTAAATSSPNANGWYNANVTVHFTCTDEAPGTCPPDQVLSSEGTSVSSTAVTVADADGFVSPPSNVVTVKIDKTAPTIVASATKADATPYTSGDWTNQTVTVHYTCTDGLSGIPAGTCPPDVTVSADTAPSGQDVSAGVTDLAGNSATSNHVVVKVDKTPPVVTAPADMIVQATGANGAKVVYPACTGTDANPPVTFTYSKGSNTLFAVGNTTVICTGMDPAGNQAQASFRISVLSTEPVKGNFSCSNRVLGAATVSGSVTVPAGKTCTLIGTQVKGNLQAVSTGGLRLDGATIGGNVQIVGLSGLPAFPPAGQTWNVICGSTIRGSLQVTTGRSPISIGDSVACSAGNRVTGNLQVTSNRAAVRVSRNTIGGTLQCASNTPAATGVAGSNTARSKTGQCAGL